MKKMRIKTKHLIVTMIDTDNIGSIMRAVVLAISLNKFQSAIPRACMICCGICDKSKKLLEAFFDHIVEIGAGSFGSRCTKFARMNILNRKIFQCEKVLFISSEIAVRCNIDDLFTLEPPAITLSSPFVESRASSKHTHGERIGADAIYAMIAEGNPGLSSIILVRPSDALWSIFCAQVSQNPCKDRCCRFAPDFTCLRVFAEYARRANTAISHISECYNWVIGKKKWCNFKGAHGRNIRVYNYHNSQPWKMIDLQPYDNHGSVDYYKYWIDLMVSAYRADTNAHTSVNPAQHMGFRELYRYHVQMLLE